MAAAWLRRSRGAQSFFFSAKPAVLWRSVHTSVWWDIDDCRVTKGCDPYSMAGNIRDAIAKLNFKGRVTFTAYGDKRRLDPNVKQALSDTRIKFKHVPYARGEYESSYVLLRDLNDWIENHPPPANCLIMSGDKDLAVTLHRLGMQTYNTFLAKPRKVTVSMEASAQILWRWTSLRAGGPPESIRGW